MNQRHYPRAIRKLRAALALDSTLASARQLLLICLVETNQAAAAAEEAGLLAALGKLSSMQAYDVGVALVESGASRREALPWFRRALELDPSSEAAQVGVANCLLNVSDPQSALAIYRALASSAHTPWVRVESKLGVAKALYDLGKAEEGRSAARAARDAVSDAPFSDADRAKAQALLDWFDAEDVAATGRDG
jgi:thioredoxin-like negative regulator of GroEL